MTDKIISLIALICFGLFLSILAIWVPHIDLLIVLGVGFGLCAYDFWRAARTSDDGE